MQEFHNQRASKPVKQGNKDVYQTTCSCEIEQNINVQNKS